MNNDSASFEAVFERLLKVTGSTTDSALARVLDIKPQSVVAARKRRQIPPGWVVVVAQGYGVSTDWLFFGKGSPFPEKQHSGRKEADQEGPRDREAAKLENVLTEQKKRILELERLLTEAKEETLKAYRLAVEAMRASGGAAQIPPPPHYGQPLQPNKDDSAEREE